MNAHGLLWQCPTRLARLTVLKVQVTAVAFKISGESLMWSIQ